MTGKLDEILAEIRREDMDALNRRTGEAKSYGRREMAAALSHELGQPVGVTTGRVQLLQMGLEQDDILYQDLTRLWGQLEPILEVKGRLEKVHHSLEPAKKLDDKITGYRLQGAKEVALAVYHELIQPAKGVFGFSKYLLDVVPENDSKRHSFKELKEGAERTLKIIERLPHVKRYSTMPYVRGRVFNIGGAC